MKKTITLTTSFMLALAMTACGSSGTSQTGGGSNLTSEPTIESSPSPTFKPGTTDDAIKAGWLAGNAKPKFKPGTEGQVDVVATGPVKGQHGMTTIVVAIRNSTNESITSIDVAGVAKDKSGKIIGSGSSQGFNPSSVPAGGIGLGYVYFGSDIPSSSKIDFTVASQPVQGEAYFQDLTVDQANVVGKSITGQATNNSELTLNGPYGVQVTCFDEKGKLLSTYGDFGKPDADLKPGQSISFQVDQYGGSCPTFLLGASGYGPLF
ncbi:FxLYD domain-containing protein [Glutamicibacter ardleyensis]|uniref:FxLYD domain-containing protein n=1 Tax=Glutamicibacter ardleyensis TaxID=225894 RepID=UPI003F98D924